MKNLLLFTLIAIVLVSCNQYENCKTDIGCWENNYDKFFNNMLVDLEDGVLDNSYWYTWSGFNDLIDKIADEEKRYEIKKIYNKKLDNISEPNQSIIMKELRLGWY